jgi:hypothetical protein
MHSLNFILIEINGIPRYNKVNSNVEGGTDIPLPLHHARKFVTDIKYKPFISILWGFSLVLK